jgi:hypothetical protein
MLDLSILLSTKLKSPTKTDLQPLGRELLSSSYKAALSVESVEA